MSTILRSSSIEFNHRREFIMNQAAAAVPNCRSIFQNGAATTTTEKYTQIWITLINQIEKSKEILAELR